MASQLEIQQALNKAVASRNELLKEQSQLIKSQLADVMGLKQAWSEVDPSQEDILRTIKSMKEVLGDTAEEFKDLGFTGESASAKISKQVLKAKTSTDAFKTVLVSVSKQFPIAAIAAAGFVDGLISGFKYVTNILNTTFGLATSITKAFKDVALSVLMIPFRSLSALIEISNKLVPLMEAIARATEDVRKQFGEISGGVGRDIIVTARDIGKEFEHLGLDGYSIFGSLDERLQSLNKTATAMGPTFELFADEIRQSNGAALLLQKGLGITDESMQGIAKRARAFGSSLTTQLKEMTKFSSSFSAKFGLSRKLISRDMSIMIDDVKNFGNLGPKELAKVSVYARKLGTDVKDLLGVVEKFDTFESAAESAAMLSQAFGAQTDAIMLMRAENPADRIDELRRAFLTTGRSAELLNRQELKMLAQTTGLSEATARAAFSQKNMGLSMSELEKQGKISEQRQLSTAEAVKELSTTIERIIKPFKTFSGFLKAFADGFARGLFQAKDFRSLLTSLHSALNKTYHAGMKVGEAFADIVPGFKGMILGIREMLKTTHPFTNFMLLITDVKESFLQLFNSLEQSPDGVEHFFETLKLSFEDFLLSFDSEQFSRRSNIFAKSIGNLMAGLIRIASNGAIQIMKIMTDVLTGKNIQDLPGGGLAASFFNPIIAELKTGQHITRLGDAFMEMIEHLWARYENKITPILQKIGAAIAATIFGSAFIKGTLAAFASVFSEALVGIIAKSIAQGQLASLTGMLASVGKALAVAISSPFVIIPAAIAAAIGAGVGVSKGMDKFRANLETEFDKTESMVGASAAGIADILSFGLIPDSAIASLGKFAAKASSAIFNAINSLPFGNMLEPAWREMISTSIEMLDSVGDLIRTIFTGNTAAITSAASTLGKKAVIFIMEGFASLAITLPATIYSLFLQMGTWALKGLGWVVTDMIPWILKGVSTLAQVLSGVLGGVFLKIGDWLGKIPILGIVLKPLFGLFGHFFNGISIVFGWLSEKFGETIKYSRLLWVEIDSVLTSISDAFRGWTSKIWKSITSVFNRDATKGTFMSLVWGADAALRELPDKFMGWIKTAWSSVLSFFGIASPSKLAKELGINVVDGLLAGLQAYANKIPETLQGITTKGLTFISDTFSSSNVTRTFKDFTSPAVTVIKSMIEEANEIGDSLSSLDPINLQTKLEALADKLGVSGEKFKIKQGQVTFMIDLNVTIEADKLVKVLAEHGIVTTEK